MEEAAFIPPPPDVLETALDEVERFIHREEPPLPLLIKVGIIHACFAEGAIKRPLLYFSHYLRRRRMQYYDSLQSTLYSQPLITVKRAAKEASVSVNYANRLVNEYVIHLEINNPDLNELSGEID